MSSQHAAAADGTDERTVQQENELQALAAIYGDDFQDLRSADPWKVEELAWLAQRSLVGHLWNGRVCLCVCFR